MVKSVNQFYGDFYCFIETLLTANSGLSSLLSSVLTLSLRYRIIFLFDFAEYSIKRETSIHAKLAAPCFDWALCRYLFHGRGWVLFRDRNPYTKGTAQAGGCCNSAPAWRILLSFPKLQTSSPSLTTSNVNVDLHLGHKHRSLDLP
jgi:hypothetical protein